MPTPALRARFWTTLTVGLLAATVARAQDGRFPTSPRDDRPQGPGGGPGMFGGGPMGQERKLVKQFDADGDGHLNAAERAEARKFMKENGGGRRPGRGPGGMRGGEEPASAGPKVSPSEVKSYPGRPLYDPEIVRTVFLDFEDTGWEAELADFYNTDVEVPATLTVDGVKYPNVGVHFRGASSFFMVSAGHKRSLNVSLDFLDRKQRLYGASTLNLLNSHEDPSFMSTVLFSELTRANIPAPKANYARVVINGESWGLYVNAEQFGKEFVSENFRQSKGARWKVKGSPNARSGLDYIGDNIEDYKKHYQMKSGGDQDWKDLIDLCRTLSETPTEELEAALKGRLDLDGVLWFLAYDVALANGDGYWVRASDYSIYKDPKGVFHIVPHDMNEAFGVGMGGPGGGPGMGPPGTRRRPGPPPADAQEGAPGDADRPQPPTGGPPDGDQERPRPREDQGPGGGLPGGPGRGRGGPGMMGGGGPRLDPLVGMDDKAKPLRSRLLAVPSLRARYLDHVRAIADQLDWKHLGPIVARHRALIEPEVKADTRKLSSFEAFERATADSPAESTQGRNAVTLRAFGEQRSKFLREYKESGSDSRTATKPEPAR